MTALVIRTVRASAARALLDSAQARYDRSPTDERRVELDAAEREFRAAMRAQVSR